MVRSLVANHDSQKTGADTGKSPNLIFCDVRPSTRLLAMVRRPIRCEIGKEDPEKSEAPEQVMMDVRRLNRRGCHRPPTEKHTNDRASVTTRATSHRDRRPQKTERYHY